MAFEQREGGGVLFPNDRKSKPNQPDFQGDALFHGQKVKLSAWKKTGKGGKDFLSLSLQDDNGQFQSRPPDPTRAGPSRPMADEESLPF